MSGSVARSAPPIVVVALATLAAVATIALLAAIPGGRTLAQRVVSGLMLGGIYVAVAVAFTLTIGVLNFLNFTIPTLFMVTGMVAWWLARWGVAGVAIPWPLALLGGVIAAVIASLIVERFTFRYLKTKHGDATEHAIPLVSSPGFLLDFEHLVLIYLGSEAQSFPERFRLDLRLGGPVIGLP